MSTERAKTMLHKRERSHRLPNGKMASEYREAMCTSFEDAEMFTTAFDWHDKPYRLVFELLEVIDQYKRKIDRLEKAGCKG